MGNNSSRESRAGHDSGGQSHHTSQGHAAAYDARIGGFQGQSERPSGGRSRAGRGDISTMLRLGSSSGAGSHPSSEPRQEQRRETKQEREARRLEKERVARLQERERSLKEEHVDGGYLVTLGTYVGPEDFNKQIVRQLQIERKLAPFWRGLNDFDEDWTEPQIIAAARGVPIPPPDQTPPDELVPRRPSVGSTGVGLPNLNNLTVPMGNRTQSTASDHSLSNAGSALPSPTSAGPAKATSPFKPRGKALAAVLGGSSRNGSTTEIVPREIQLPQDPFVNGQPMEVFLYRNATECPICFLTYPPYLNHTRCCDQPICSECFVQIKRPDPHYPEGHNENDPSPNPEEPAGMLVSEPACCPYCTQPDFGITYEPPPFRRGLTHTFSLSTVGTTSTAMSSSSSLNSATLSPTLGSPVAQGNRRRTQSLSANAPNVTLTDKIRPDWSTKLQAARAHQARRSAAATALHTAAFLMSNTETSRPFRTSRFGRRNTGSGTPSPGGTSTSRLTQAGLTADNGGSGSGTPAHAGLEPGARGSSGRSMLLAGSSVGGGDSRNRMEDLEDMMLMEAIRLSLAAEEERKRKADKEERKEAKKREKEERKRAKSAAKHGGPYEAGEGRSGHSSASGSNLSLPSLAFGRKRGNSGASNLRVEASVARAVASTSTSTSGPGSPVGDSAASTKDKGKAVERSLPSTPEGSQDDVEDDAMAASSSTITAAATTTPRPIPSPHQPVGPSHLRQMSSASSITSSPPDSQAGSYTAPSHLQDPSASAISLDHDRDQDPSASTEPMFNFRSLAEVVGVSLEGEHAGRRLSRIEADKKAQESAHESIQEVAETPASPHDDPRVEEANDDAEGVEPTEDVDRGEPSFELGMPASAPQESKGFLAPPEVMITPETPAVAEDGHEESKQLGYKATTVEELDQVTQ